MGASRAIFVAVGLFQLLIGVLTMGLTDRGIGPNMIIVSVRTDLALFGAPTEEILASNPELTTFRYITIRTLAGLLAATGMLIAGLAWFGMREAPAWTLALLTVTGLALLPFWWMALSPYREAGIGVGLGDMPPFMWVPAIAMPVASVLAWVAYMQA